MAELDRAAARLEDLVPEVVAFSVDAVRSGVTVTYVAAGLDDRGAGASVRDDQVGVAWEGGSAEDADDLPTAAPVGETVDDPLDEAAWQRSALAHAAPGIRSSLSLPVIESGLVVADVTVYGGTETTFEGLGEEVARIFGAWAGGAVSNADLAFDSRRDAAATLVRLTDLETVELAAQILAEERGLDVEHVRDRMYRAAERAGIPVARLARVVIDDRRDPS
jgi:hypothetical protein